MRRFWFVFGCSLLLTAAARAEEEAQKAVSFRRDVAPILIKHCAGCHGAKETQGGYRVDSFERLVKAGESGEASITPKKPDASELYKRLTSDDESIRMPLDAAPLSAAAIETFKRWIDQGALYDADDPAIELAAIVPREQEPEAPAVYRAALPITALAFSNDGATLFASGYHEITAWNVKTGALERRIGNVGQRVYDLSVSPDGSLLAVAAGAPGVSGEVKVFDVSTGMLRQELVRMSDVALGVAFRPDGKKLAACGADKTVRIFNVESGAQERLIEEHADWVHDVAWSDDGLMIATASRDKTAKVFDATTGAMKGTYTRHGESVLSVVFSSDGKSAISAASDGEIHAWNIESATLSGKFEPTGENALSLVRGERRLFALSAVSGISSYALDSRKRESRFDVQGHASAMAFSGSENLLAAGAFDGNVVVLEAATGKELRRFGAAPGR